ncbi:MAG: hypothetical protein RR365_14170 [Bacteroides sp.]
MRLIDADALKELAYESDDFDYQQVIDWDDIEDAPTIDAVPVVHAHIIGTGYNLYCSNCKESADIGNDYCPHCGAKMDTEEERP